MKTTTPLIAGLALTATMAAAETPVLTVYAPDYFGSDWGPGPAIEQMFEATCDCDLKFSTGDLLPRLLLEGDTATADAAIGFNTDVMKRARETGLFADHGLDQSGITLPVDWDDSVFVPFNYGHTAFVYDEDNLATPPADLDAMRQLPDDVKVVIQDPRSSISGLALALWVDHVYGDEAEGFWADLAPNILTVTKGWSESYGLFTSGEAEMVLSYTTSPAYHAVAEDDPTIHAAIFPEGHYFMVETAAMLKGSDQPELARAFLEMILSDAFQTAIPLANWSLPSALPDDQWPEEMADLPLPEKVLFYSEDEAAERRDAAIAAWSAGLRQ
ncbi:MAG: thiamine ABC transporter substrate-binding protein [Rhodobacterales bacterium]|nr:MAG: thiamine ABC transporter substrate-binding protein [Rhodobacterales bacterium]